MRRTSPIHPGYFGQIRRSGVSAGLVLASVFLVLACGNDDDARPFGTDPETPWGGGLSGAAGQGGRTGQGLVRGTAGALGTLDVTRGTGGDARPSAGSGGATNPAGSGGQPGAGSATGAGGANLPPAASGGIGTPGNSGSGGLSGTGGASVAATGGRSAVSTGGTVGSGGSHSGGSSGTGGIRGTGGSAVSGSGGVPAPGTGGARTSTGGAPGTGGAPVGSGGAMAPGTGGSTGTTAECQQYIADYDAEMQAARMCKDSGNGNAKSCAALVPARLAGCGSNCTTYVDKANMLEQIQRKWTMSGCTAPACAVSVCLNPTSATCSAAGVCSSSVL